MRNPSEHINDLAKFVIKIIRDNQKLSENEIKIKLAEYFIDNNIRIKSHAYKGNN